MEYLSCFDFDIRYVKGKLNKVADALSHYYQFDSWDNAPLVQHYVFADVWLDPNHEDLLWDRHLELKNQVIETRSTVAQQKQVGEQLKALRELIEERDESAARMTPNSEESTPCSSDGLQSGDNPSIYASQAKGPDLHIRMSEVEPLNDDIQDRYVINKVFKKVLENPEDHPDLLKVQIIIANYSDKSQVW